VNLPGGCGHIRDLDGVKHPKAHVCEDCVKMGSTWVHLRTCQTCQGTRCCDNSPNQHATKHARSSGHPATAPGNRKGTKALAPSTLNIFPKFELVPMTMYFMMLAKHRRPSTIPSFSTDRSFSRRMIFAASLATSTPFITEIPTSAVCNDGASLMPSPMYPTT